MRQKLLLLLAITLALNAGPIRAQDEDSGMPFIVDPPQLSKSEFTDWTRIKITFTVRYLDGYEPEMDLADPSQMSFGFELDPQYGQKLVIENERKLRKENYKDFVYYVRLIQEKKGDIIIPEQVFHYVKILPGQARENLEVKEFKTQPVTVKYDSVLPSNADDIQDGIDYGSFKAKAHAYKAVAAGGFFLTWFAMLFLVFRNPMTQRVKARNAKKLAGGKAEAAYVLSPKAAIKVFTDKLNRLGAGATLAALHNNLREFLVAYQPDLAFSDTSEEMLAKVSRISDGRRKSILLSMVSKLKSYEDNLYEGSAADAGAEILSMRRMAADLKGYRIFFAELQDAKGLNKIKHLWRKAVRR